MQLFSRYVSPRGLTVFTCELFLIGGSLLMAAVLRGQADASHMYLKIGLVTLLYVLCLYYNDFYDLTVVQSSRELIVRLCQAAGTATLLLAIGTIAIPGISIGGGTLVLSLFVFLGAILAWRLAFNRFLRSSTLEERILVIGTGTPARTVARQILLQRDFGYRVVGFIDNDAARIGERIVNPGIIGTPADIPRLVAEKGIDRIVVGLTDRRGKLPVEELLWAKLSGVAVEDTTTVYERLTGKILIDDLKPSWLIFSDGFRVSRLTRVLKRTIDLVFAFTGFILAAPLIALTAVAIWLETGRPILYRQERVGERGRVFTLYKMRSMHVDAERGTPQWAASSDDRVTRVGRFIRTTRLDELPQFWNVLRGDMSFVGPRPERPFFVDQLERAIPFYQQRHVVRPGVTGWAQIKYRYGASIEDAMEKLRYDLYYVKHLSIALDLTIVFDTVKVTLFGRGAQ
jgi:sugar transferase (PEP-CTERM system associated)